jgi:hypothetical protein
MQMTTGDAFAVHAGLVLPRADYQRDSQCSPHAMTGLIFPKSRLAKTYFVSAQLNLQNELDCSTLRTRDKAAWWAMVADGLKSEFKSTAWPGSLPVA